MTNSELSPGVKLLRKIVIAMGYLLIIGTLALFVAVYFKYSHKTSTPTSSFAMQSSSEKCSFKPTADIEITENIITSNISDNILTIITTNKVVIFDLCSGELLSRLNIVKTH